jgi:uncharacterized protein (DUF305 family)
MGFSRIILARAHPLAALAVAAACIGSTRADAQGAQHPTPDKLSALAKARADSASRLFTAADVRFMSAMIHHHAQAITMSRMAPTHGASESVRTLASRIINAQQDEIATMQRWLRDRGQPVPDPFAPMSGAMHDMHGMQHDMSGMSGMDHGASHDSTPALMPGMLTDAQMRQLDSARGPAFDRLFLTDMIQHHRGAVSMVKDLFSSYGAGQDEAVFKFASDVNVDQTTEIARMERMLVTLLFENPSR